MALTNQPYLPLYVNDWLSSTKLRMCTAKAHGIMINTMLLMHKEDDYGYILLKQKFKQTDKQILNFASQFAKILPFDVVEIESGLNELVDEGCLYLEGDLLKCKRMVKDADISIKRSASGSKGGTASMKKQPKKETEFASEFAQAKNEANSIIEIINDINIENDINDGEFEKIFIRWIDYKKNKKQKYKSKDSIGTAYKHLLEYSGNKPQVAHKIIDDAIAANYSGFFKPKTTFIEEHQERKFVH